MSWIPQHTPAGDRVFIRLAGQLDLLDARKLVSELRRGMKKPHESYMRDRDAHEKHKRNIECWRARIQNDYNVPRAAA